MCLQNSRYQKIRCFHLSQPVFFFVLRWVPKWQFLGRDPTGSSPVQPAHIFTHMGGGTQWPGIVCSLGTLKKQNNVVTKICYSSRFAVQPPPKFRQHNNNNDNLIDNNNSPLLPARPPLPHNNNDPYRPAHNTRSMCHMYHVYHTHVYVRMVYVFFGCGVFPHPKVLPREF